LILERHVVMLFIKKNHEFEIHKLTLKRTNMVTLLQSQGLIFTMIETRAFKFTPVEGLK